MPFSVFVKGMVCSRCKFVVTQLFKDLGMPPLKVYLGEVVVEKTPSGPVLKLMQEKLQSFGFELIDDNRLKSVVKIKSLLIGLLETDSFDLKIKLSEYLAEKLHYEYHYLSNLFSEVAGSTIENYFIRLKVEKVKELVEQGKLSLSEISYKLGYSSPAHLTNQFKRITGITPTGYKRLNVRNRSQLEDL